MTIGNTCLRWHLAAQRLWHVGGPLRQLAKLIRYANQVVFGCFIGLDAQIDPTVHFGHNGLGTVVHESVTIGARTVIWQQVTLGLANPGGGVAL